MKTESSLRVRRVAAELTITARTMRQAMTPAEEVLWQHLKGRRLKGLRFRSQHAVETFIFDFYCPACKLVIEIDGGVHDTPEAIAHDQARKEHIEAHGYHVLRFRNEEVLTNLRGVLHTIGTTALPLAEAIPEQ